jgi:hypothetical protein
VAAGPQGAVLTASASHGITPNEREKPRAENTRGAVDYRPIRYDAEKQPPHTSEEKQPLRESAAKQKISLLIRRCRAEISLPACPPTPKNQLVANGSDLTPTNPLHQIGDGQSIPAPLSEVQYMFVRLSINHS